MKSTITGFWGQRKLRNIQVEFCGDVCREPWYPDPQRAEERGEVPSDGRGLITQLRDHHLRKTIQDVYQEIVRVPGFNAAGRERRRGKVPQVESHDDSGARLHRCGKDMPVLRVVRHFSYPLLVVQDESLRKVKTELLRQVVRFPRIQLVATLQIPGQLFNYAIRPFRNILSGSLGETKQRVAQGGRKKDAGIQHRDNLAAGFSRQSELVVDTVADGFVRQTGNRIVAAQIALLSKGNQVLQLNAPMGADAVESYFPVIQQSDEELA